MASGPVLQVGGGGAAGDISSPISGKTPDIGSTQYWYIATLLTHRERYRGLLSRYPYRDHIGPDIGEKPDTEFGKERVCPDIEERVCRKERVCPDIDIGEKPDTEFGKERVCPDIDPIS